MNFAVALDPDTADAVLALSVASGLTPSGVVRALLDTIPAPAPRRRPARRWPLVAAAASGLLLLAIAARRSRPHKA